MTSVDLIIAETLSPSLRSSFSMDSFVIIAVMISGDVTSIFTLDIIAPISMLFTSPSNTFLALIFILSPQFLCMLLYTSGFKKVSHAENDRSIENQTIYC